MVRRNALQTLPLLFTIACGAAAPPSPASPCALPVQVALEAGSRINPDTTGQALPTVVRLYQTSGVVRLEGADFEDIWERPEPTLGDELIEVQQFTLFPGKAERVPVELKPSARYLIGMAVFRRPTGRQWRSIMPLPPSARLCAAYEGPGAPSPALRFAFDLYRVDGRSMLDPDGLGAHGQHDLPQDVAPEVARPATTSGGDRGLSDVKMPDGAPDAPSAPDAPAPPLPGVP